MRHGRTRPPPVLFRKLATILAGAVDRHVSSEWRLRLKTAVERGAEPAELYDLLDQLAKAPVEERSAMAGAIADVKRWYYRPDVVDRPPP